MKFQRRCSVKNHDQHLGGALMPNAFFRSTYSDINQNVNKEPKFTFNDKGVLSLVGTIICISGIKGKVVITGFGFALNISGIKINIVKPELGFHSVYCLWHKRKPIKKPELGLRSDFPGSSLSFCRSDRCSSLLARKHLQIKGNHYFNFF